MTTTRTTLALGAAALAAACAISVGAPPAARAEETPAAPTSLYDLEARTLEGEAAPLAAYRGKVTLVVNVASECGFTRQYAGLQALHARLSARGFAVLGFPSNEFGGQEPGDAATIRGFCTDRYQVTFPLFAKCATKAGASQSPVFALLGKATGQLPNWNFCKYLVGKDGKPLGFYPSRVAPDDAKLLEAIEAALAAK